MTCNESYSTERIGFGVPATSSPAGTIAGTFARAFTSFFAACSGFMANLERSIARAYKIRKTYAELSRLDDRSLKDIGISRGEIGAVALHSADYPGVSYPRSGEVS